jgi:hypothetical protein
MDGMAGTAEFTAWVEKLVRDRFRTKRALASAIGLTESPFGRGVEAGSLGVDSLLRLAMASEAHPSFVLRLAGKKELADLIERLYGPGKDALTESQRTLLELWDRLPDEESRRSMLFTLRAIGNAAAHGKASESSSTTRRGARGSSIARGPASSRRS